MFDACKIFTAIANRISNYYFFSNIDYKKGTINRNCKKEIQHLSGTIFHVENNKHSEWPQGKFVEAKGINAI